MKAFITLSLLLAASPALAQFSFSDPEQETLSDSEAIFANRVLKRRLQTDKRLAVQAISKANGAGADVYASLPFESGHLHLLLGRYHAFGQGSADTEGPALKGNKDEQRLAQTRFKAEQLILGSAASDVKVLDEFGAQPVAVDEGPSLNKLNPVDSFLITAFDLALADHLTQALNRTLAAKSDKPRMINNQIVLLAMTGNIDGAIALIKNNPIEQDAAARYPIQILNQAAIYLAHKDFSLALETLEKLKSSELTGRLGLAAMRMRTSALALSGDKEKSKLALEETLKRYPNNAGVLTMAGDLAISAGQWSEAAQFLKQAASLNKNSAEALIKLSQCQAKLGDLDSALKSAAEAAHNFPDSLDAHIALGKLHLDNKEFLGARLQFERALEVSHGFKDKKQVFTLLMKALDIMNDDKELLKYTAQWVKEYPQEPVSHYNRAYVLAEKKQESEAIAEYQKAIALAPEYNRARFNLALLLIKNKKETEAKPQLERITASGTSLEKEQAEKLLKSLR